MKNYTEEREELDKIKEQADDCEAEPVSTPGAIQPHGVLLVLSQKNFEVLQLSNNVGQLLGRKVKDLLDRPITRLLGEEQTQQLRQKITAESERSPDPYLRSLPHTQVSITVKGKEKEFDAITHRSEQGFYLLELEPRELYDDYPIEGPYQLTKNAILQMQQAKSISSLYQIIVNEIARLTGFDRVMVYKFDEEYHGKVVAEYLRKGTFDISYLDLHFPNSDIPANARQLYMKNWLRLIPDRNYEAVEVVPFRLWQQDNPLDLSQSVLRSVSPYHLEYLSVMGVQATMSISLFEGDRLWGLIACHSQRAHYIPYSIRQTCEFVGQSLSLMLAQRQERRVERKLKFLEEISRKLSMDLVAGSNLTKVLENRQQDILKLMQAQGFAIVDHVKTHIGKVPQSSQLDDLCHWLDMHIKPGDQRIFSTNRLVNEYDEARKFEGVSCGLLAVRIEHPTPGYLLWFRGAVENTIKWAGKPEKRMITDKRGLRFGPRKSFALWQEMQRGCSTPWTLADQQIAGEFRIRLYELQSNMYKQMQRENILLEKKIRERTDELTVANDMLKQAIKRKEISEEELLKSLTSLKTANEDLERFAYVTSHDLREPLRAISNFSHLLKNKYAEQLGTKGSQYIQFIQQGVQRMQVLIEDLLKYSRVQKKASIPKAVNMDVVVNESIKYIKVMLQESGGSVEVETPMPRVKGERSLLMQLLQNLLSNAIKYRHPERPLSISLGAEEKDKDYYRFWVKDNGIGIAKEYHEVIFEIFVRLFTPEEYRGTGIGLAICQKIVHKFGGKIYVDSEPDRGAVFYFTLPKA